MRLPPLRGLALAPLIVLSCLFSISAQPKKRRPPSPTLPADIQFSSKELKYLEQDALTKSGSPIKSWSLHLKGQVEIRRASATPEGAWRLSSEEAWMDMEKQTLRATGDVRILEEGSLLRGPEAHYDLKTRTGEILQGKGVYPPWFFRGRRIKIHPPKERGRKLEYVGAHLTTCELHPAHYHLRARKLTVTPGESFWARDALFFLGPVPVFYSPLLYKSLRGDSTFHILSKPGYNRREGVILKNSILYAFSPALYGKTFLDFFGKKGLGVGEELNYQNSDAARGSLYGYWIDEKDTGLSRWTVLGNLWQDLSPSPTGPRWGFQTRLQQMSDADFNNLYFRSNTLRIATELNTSAALVRSGAKTTTRLSYNRRDLQKDRTNDFEKSVESLPRLDFQTTALGVPKLPLLFSFNASYDRPFEPSGDFYRNNSSAQINILQTLPVSRRLSLNPQVSFQENWQDRAGATDLQDQLIGRYTLAENLRLRDAWGDWDLSHTFQRRLKVNTFSVDQESRDKGIEQNRLFLQQTLRPDRRLLMRTFTGFDLSHPRGDSRRTQDRWEPLALDLNWTLKKAVSLYFREDYLLNRGNRSTIAQLDFGYLDSRYTSLGVSASQARPGHLFVNQGFGWAAPDGNWRAQLALRYDTFTTGGIAGLEHLRFFEKELTLTKLFHDFLTRLSLRSRPGVKEVLFRIDLKVDAARAQKVIHRERESEWYPWRRNPSAD
ncbi:MAG: hypothetical protein HY402_00020 [Elusimicrobia bacterium]|nr:hypothetical protein [Elusimicrobiota bacterium]